VHIEEFHYYSARPHEAIEVTFAARVPAEKPVLIQDPQNALLADHRES
jgi:hypothetical protein